MLAFGRHTHPSAQVIPPTLIVLLALGNHHLLIDCGHSLNKYRSLGVSSLSARTIPARLGLMAKPTARASDRMAANDGCLKVSVRNDRLQSKCLRRLEVKHILMSTISWWCVHPRLSTMSSRCEVGPLAYHINSATTGQGNKRNTRLQE